MNWKSMLKFLLGIKAKGDLAIVKKYIGKDLVLATYDATSINAQYAEPNKMHESIFFRVPIIVSKGTFLSEKVDRLGIGYAINGLDKDEIRTFLAGLTAESIESKVKNLMAIPKKEAVNENPEMFENMKKLCN